MKATILHESNGRQADDAIRILKADAPEIKTGISGVKRRAEFGIRLIQVAPHAGALAALPGIKKCEFHVDALFSAH